MEAVLGIVKGPDEKPNEYCFITTNNEMTKVGEFVYYEIADGNKVVGSIIGKKLVRGLPESFMSDPTISPHEISSLMGCDISGSELFQVSVLINGYFDEMLKSFVNPRIYPAPGTRVYNVSDNYLSKIISNKEIGDIGSANIGSLLTRSSDSVPVVLDVKNLVSTHLTILASTGSGKSYTSGVLVEELLKPNNRASVFIVDPHNEYDTLKEIESNPLFSEGNYSPKVKIFPPDKVKVRVSSLTESDIRYLLPNLSEKMTHYLSIAFKNVAKNIDPDEDGSYLWGLSDLFQELENMIDRDPEAESTLNALQWRLRHRIENSRIFNDSQHIRLNELFAPGQCSVLQLSEIDQTEQQVIVSTILRRINKARIDTHKGNIDNTDTERYIPYPVFIILEEAHRFAPANTPSVSLNILKTILSEGRKFGVGVGLITQRPGKLDSDVLSQCMTQIIMKIINPIDQSSIAAGVEAAGTQLLKELPSLTKGQVIVSGSAINMPVLCKIRKRLTNHGGETIDAPACWLEYFSDTNMKSRKVDSSVLLNKDLSEKYKGYSI